MNHFFVKPEAIEDGLVYIKGDDVKHISKSLRLSSGDKITVADGAGNSYLVELISLSQELIRGKIIKELARNVESELEITICQGLPKSKKMDLVVQKGTELGVKRIIPVAMEHSIVKLTPSKAKRRVKRWQKIALEAAKQSKRGIIPQVEKLHDFKEALNLTKESDLAIIPWVGEKEKSLKEVIKEAKAKADDLSRIIVFVGPEGGFASSEVKKAQQTGVIPVSFGPRTLRTETASIFAVGTLAYEFGA